MNRCGNRGDDDLQDVHSWKRIAQTGAIARRLSDRRVGLRVSKFQVYPRVRVEFG